MRFHYLLLLFTNIYIFKLSLKILKKKKIEIILRSIYA